MTEVPYPSAVRRPVAFCEAVPDGETVVEDVRAVLCPESTILHARDGSYVPVFVDPSGDLVQDWRPDVVIDGRILKRNLDNHVGQAPLVIGLGPGLVAGKDVDVVIETERGHDLGRIIREGEGRPDTGIPGVIGGYSGQRVLRSPVDGRLEAHAEIGQIVQEGAVVAVIAGRSVVAGVSGVLRGLCRPRLLVQTGQKIGDVDPRGDRASCFTLSDKTRAISGGVLEAILAWDLARG